MLGQLAQTTYTYTTTTTNSTGNGALWGGLAIFSGVFLIVWAAVAIFLIVTMWKLFEKAGEAGWKSIIPVYNFWVLCEIAGKPGWWSLVVLLGFVPIINFVAWIPVLIVEILVSIEVAKAFGKEPVWALLLILLPIVGYPMLAFGDAKYTKPAATKKAA